ncbi:MAG: hypothetical protein M0009_07900 [Deltaproteobacteria bacterium]|nr:hypothetical protein [Deltaproteobacteria bacterium]
MSLVGKNIDAFCLRCQLTLAHIVLYEVAGAVHSVKCKTCGAEHRYRGPKPAKKREVPAERRPGGRLGSAAKPNPVRPADARQWELRSAEQPPDAAIWDYRLSESYEKGDIIAHAHFGRGFVEQVTADRMEVLFKEGRKQLAMNRRPVDAGTE